MSNSSLVSYTKLSPNKYDGRSHKIDTITPHCVVGQVQVEALGDLFAKPSRKASSNYGIGKDGRIALYVDEKDTSWCSSNKTNDSRAITIEIASDTTHPYAITDAAYKALVNLCEDICRRHNIPKLLWKADKSLIGKTDQQNITVHRWFANKACPGDYIYERLGAIADEVNRRLGSSAKPSTTATPKPTISSSMKPFLVRVNRTDLNIRSGPGTNYSKSTSKIAQGVYTIVETKSGTGSKAGWGKLKSGQGWISLDYVTKM